MISPDSFASTNATMRPQTRRKEGRAMRHRRIRTLGFLLAAVAAIDVFAPATAQEVVKLELWSRQDPSGPLRPGNVVKGAERLNKELSAEGVSKRVEVAVHESPAPGFDDDALQLLK